MVVLFINGLEVSVEEGATLLEASRFYGFPIPTLCHMDGLSPYGACRLSVCGDREGSEGEIGHLMHRPSVEGLRVRTASSRVVKAGKLDP